MKNYLDLGNWNAICDSCGRKYKASMLRKRWDGLMVCEQDYETRHPSDFLRVQRERIAVPWARPVPTDTFIPVIYICTQEGSTAIAGMMVAGCSTAGSYSGSFGLQRSAVAGIMLTGQALAGHI